MPIRLLGRATLLCGALDQQLPIRRGPRDRADHLHRRELLERHQADTTQPQNLDNLQTNPPQFHALSKNDALVTVGIGGNDAGLIGVAEECARLDATSPNGTPCKDHYTASDSDPNVAAINAAGQKIAGVLSGIHQKAPNAKVLIVGYPDGLPTDGSSCWPLVPITAGDITYFNGLEQQLNQVIAGDAAADNATFVDTWNSSIGHDACKPPGVAWVNGIVPNSVAFPLHPNQMGEQKHGQSGADRPRRLTSSRAPRAERWYGQPRWRHRTRSTSPPKASARSGRSASASPAPATCWRDR